MRQPDELTLDLDTLLRLDSVRPPERAAGQREFRIRGIDEVIKQLKLKLSKDEANAINRYLRLCPSIEQLTNHLVEHYPESRAVIDSYADKLHQKLPKLID